jgi:hypothetical protein
MQMLPGLLVDLMAEIAGAGKTAIRAKSQNYGPAAA